GFYLCCNDSFNVKTACVIKITSSKLFRHPLSCITVLIYAIVGFALGNLRMNFGLWGLGILFYHWHLANFDNSNIHYTRENHFQQILIALTSGLMSSAITILIHEVKSNLPVCQPIAIGLITAINSTVMMVLTVRDWGRLKFIIFSTALAWLGLLLGWIAQYHLLNT
ncbi:hypothetical protein, partial [Nostoc sp.]|uniref:hypothetical protein n=1 Tax=Nostoc sp. TaxID=1180 RepID=UPI002FFBE610